MTRAWRDPFRDHDPFRLYVFVPAIMSAGLLFSISTLVRDAVAARGRERARHRAELEAAATVAAILGSGPDPRFCRSRRFYALVGATALAMSAYLIPGATFNYLRDNGYVANIAWVLCLALAIGAVLAVVGVSGLVSAVTWPVVRPSVRWFATDGSERATPVGSSATPTTGLGAGILLAVAALTFLTLGVGVGRFGGFDPSMSDRIRGLDLPWIVDAAAGLGATPVALVLATAIGAVATRCRTFAIAWIATVSCTFAADLVVKRVVERPRPIGALEDSFPSGHIAQLVLLAVVVPVALRVVIDRRWIGRVLSGALLVGAALGALQRVHVGMHWPTDVLAGAALGLAAALVLRWVVLHGSWHPRCVRCPWSVHVQEEVSP